MAKEKKKSRKKRIRLKRSARRTIAALLMVTAIIVAAIPVQNVEAEDDDTSSAEVTFPTIDEICEGYQGNYGITDENSLSVSVENAYKSDGTLNPEVGRFAFIVKNGQEELTWGPNGSKLYPVDSSGMVSDLAPVFFISSKLVNGFTDLIKYCGGGTSGYQASSIDLTANVCYVNYTSIDTSTTNLAPSLYIEPTGSEGLESLEEQVTAIPTPSSDDQISPSSGDQNSNVNPDNTVTDSQDNGTALSPSPSPTADASLTEPISEGSEQKGENTDPASQNSQVTVTPVPGANSTDNETPDNQTTDTQNSNTQNEEGSEKVINVTGLKKSDSYKTSSYDVEVYNKEMPISMSDAASVEEKVSRLTYTPLLLDSSPVPYMESIEMSKSETEGRLLYYRFPQLKEITIDGAAYSFGYYNLYQVIEPYDQETQSYKKIEITDEQDSDLSVIGSYCTDKATIGNICDKAFKDANNVGTINIPVHTVSIGNEAFSGCTMLKSFSIGPNMQSIGEKAFQGCSELSSFTFDEYSALTTLGDGIFANCKALADISLPTNINTIGSGAFFGSGLTGSIHGNSDTGTGMFAKHPKANSLSIGSYAFANCDGIEKVELYDHRIEFTPSSGNVVGCFKGCDALTTVELPSSSTGEVNKETFAGCDNLTSVRVNDGNAFVTMGEDSFIGVKGIYDSQTSPYRYKGNDECELVLWGGLPETTRAIYNYSLNHDLTYKYIKDGQTYYERCLGGYKYEFRVDDEAALTGTLIGVQKKPSATQADLNYLTVLDKIGPYTLTAVADGALDAENLSDVTPLHIKVKSGIESIGKGAFQGNRVSDVFIEVGDNGLTIGDNAFEGCPNLEYVHIYPDKVGGNGEVRIGNKCFADCSSLQVINLKDDNHNNQDGVGITNVVSLGTDAFKTGRTEAVDEDVLDDYITPTDYTFDDGVRIGTKSSYLIIIGDMREGYAPYDYSILPTSLVSGSTGTDHYTLYCSGNPENLSCRYSMATGKVELLTYPTIETIINRNISYSDNGSGTKTPPAFPANFGEDSSTEYEDQIYLKDLIQKQINDIYSTQGLENQIISAGKYVNVPEGINSVTHALNIRTMNEAVPDDSLKNVNCAENDSGSHKAGDGHGLNSLTLYSVTEIAEKGLANDFDLSTVSLVADITDLGAQAFYKDLKLNKLDFTGEGDPSTNATTGNPYYWCDNGIIYSYDGSNVTLEQVLPGRGYSDGIDDPEISSEEILTSIESKISGQSLDKIETGAFEQCNYVESVDLTGCTNLSTIPTRCFYSCDKLEEVDLPSGINLIQDLAFAKPDSQGVEGNKRSEEELREMRRLDLVFNSEPVIEDQVFFNNSAELNGFTYENKKGDVELYVEDHQPILKYNDNLKFSGKSATHEVNFYLDAELTDLYETQSVDDGKQASKPSTDPTKSGYIFSGWSPNPESVYIYTDRDFVAMWIPDTPTPTVTPTGTPTSKPTSTPTSSPTATPTGSSSNKSSSQNSSSNRSSSVNGSSMINSSTTPVVVSGIAQGYTPAVTGASPNTGTGTTGGGTVNKGNGSTNVISTTPGISDTGKMSATVKGSSDNYILKITHSDEADQLAAQALTAKYGSLEHIRYLPMDISLYDGTGTNKISPIPEGVNVNVSTPIPDDLAIYGGNAKVASTIGGKLEDITPRFSVVTGTPMMTFTATHLSPYVIYVDTANLADVGIMDNTPKTGDMIHPKWFLVIGLCAASIFLFLKRDKNAVKAAS
ncbi:MAG: leucine-rich repeat protein [Lachnospiraceae bacterium]|nr:leucine-rich repeat protein [Lachnospiraceae bacterium]